MSAADQITPPLSTAEANRLFSDLTSAPALVLAVSGGPDSTALLFLAARWRKARKRGPQLLAVTVDHGLREEAAAEARAVARLARKLGVPHRVLRWNGPKPKSGLQEKARAMRYRLLAEAAAKAGATHILTAHTLDDQAETVLMRLLRGSGPTGLAGMARETTLREFSSPSPSPSNPGLARDSRHRAQVGQARLALGEGRGGGHAASAVLRGPPPSRIASRSDLPRKGGGKKEKRAMPLTLFRPFLEISKAQLLATLAKAKIAFADDPSNRDPRFTRVRMRALMPALAQEGLGAKRLAVLSQRLRRAEAALEMAVDRAAELAKGWSAGGKTEMAARHFAALPAEVALRLLGRAVTIAGNEGPVELAKLELLYAAMTEKKAAKGRFRRTLAGAMVTLSPETLTVEPAPARRKP